jgi:hypothetical protein
MRTFVAAGFLAAIAAGPALAQNAAPDSHAAPVCIRPFDEPTGSIDHTHVVDPRTILFYMKDGKVWKNTLPTPCPGLLYHGFSFLTRQDEVCSNAQGIRVIESGEVCQLGAFTPYAPPATQTP